MPVKRRVLSLLAALVLICVGILVVNKASAKD